MIKAYAALEPGGELTAYEYDPGELAADEVEIAVEHCGICHSDLSMLDNEWGITQYPFVPGHEIVGKVVQLGADVSGLSMGQRVGVGWHAGSCMHCDLCMSGDHNLCASAQATIVGRFGGFADKVRAKAAFAVALPEALSAAASGPLFCGGITVFSPMREFDVKPTDRVGVIGIGGLGHMALRFLNAWGCEVTAFTSSDGKAEEAKAMGARHVVNSRDPEALKPLRGQFDFILSTVNVNLDWNAYLSALKPKGRLHFVGAVIEPASLAVMALIGGQKSVSGSPVGSPAMLKTMLEFSARHQIEPMVESFSFSDVNAAMQHLRDGKARYRIVLSH